MLSTVLIQLGTPEDSSMNQDSITLYTPKFNNGEYIGAIRWEKTFSGWYFCDEYAIQYPFIDIECIIRNHGEWCVIKEYNHGNEYYEVVPNDTDFTIGKEVVLTTNFSDCWKFAEGYNKL